MIWNSQMVRERMKLTPNIVHRSWRKQPGEDSPLPKVRDPHTWHGHCCMSSKKGWNKYFQCGEWKGCPSLLLLEERRRSISSGCLKELCMWRSSLKPQRPSVPQSCRSRLSGTALPRLPAQLTGKSKESKWWERLKKYHWLPLRLKEGPRGHPKMGNPQRQRQPGLMHTLVMWRSSSSAAWQGIMRWFLAFLHGSDGLVGTSPLLGSTSKASWLSVLAEGDSHINRIIQEHAAEYSWWLCRLEGEIPR